MEYGISDLCAYLECSRSGYYDWCKRGKPKHNQMDPIKAEAILEIYMNRPTRGRRQVQMQLERQYALHMSLGSVHRYMSIMKLNSLRKKRYVFQKKEAQNPLHTFPNVLQQDFYASKCHSKWLTDITYLPCKDGLLYLSCIKDPSDKSIIAYSFSNKNDLRLVLDTLHKAEPSMKAGTILHSDRGSQYCSHVYHKYLSDHGLIGSMSRPATPYDNAPMESFFSILKNEELKLHKNRTCAQMQTLIRRFISYYNSQRPQLGLNKLTPIEFGSQL